MGWRNFVPRWLPAKWTWRDRLLLIQASLGLLGLGFVAVLDFGRHDLPPDNPGKAVAAVFICWLFASIAAPIGIFKKKAWGHLLEVPASIPFMILIVRLASETGTHSVGDQFWIITLSFLMARWLWQHAIAGLRLAKVLKAAK